MSEKSLHILQIILNLDLGGAQEMVYTLSKQLQEEGHRPVVCSFRDGPLHERLVSAGIPVEILPDRRYSILAFPLFVWEMIKIRKKLIALINRYEIEIIQTHLLQSLDFLTATLPRPQNLPHIFWTVHNYHFLLQKSDLDRNQWLLKPKRIAYRLLYRLIVPHIDGLIAVSDDVKEQILRMMGPFSRKVTVIPNCIDVNRYQQTVDRQKKRKQLEFSRDDYLMLVVATLKKQKGHRHLIDAAREVTQARRDVHILFAGDGVLREQLQDQVHSLGLENNIHFLGNRRDIPELLAASDAFILPSLWEGLPMALMEAMASGLPIIATDVSGSRQLIPNREYGLLVPPGDAGALSSAMLYLLSNPQDSEKMSLAARRRVQKSFSAEKQAQDHLRLYQKNMEQSKALDHDTGAIYG